MTSYLVVFITFSNFLLASAENLDDELLNIVDELQTKENGTGNNMPFHIEYLEWKSFPYMIATPWLLYILDLVEDLVGNLTNDEKVAFKNGLFMLFRKLKGTEKEGASRGINNAEITPENVTELEKTDSEDEPEETSEDGKKNSKSELIMHRIILLFISYA